MSIEDTSSKLANLTLRFDDFTRRFEILFSELAVSKNWNLFLSKRIIQLERQAVSITQYNRRKSIEISPVPTSISDEEMEDNVCKTLSLAGHEVIPDDFQWSQPRKTYHIIDIEKRLSVYNVDKFINNTYF